MFKVVDESGKTIGSLIWTRKRSSGEVSTISPSAVAPVGIQPEVLAVMRNVMNKVRGSVNGIEHYAN
jgi:hypothetical protein